jgi:hypothetical protein
MAYKVLDVYQDLPRTNCGECGKSGCFAFASGVYLEGASLSACPHLGPEERSQMEGKLEAGRARGEGRRPQASEQALDFLRGRLSAGDFATTARRCGAEYLAGPPEALRLALLGSPYRLTADDVTALEGEPPTVWVKILLLIYATRARGAAPARQWAAYRELPNTASKARTFEENAGRLAEAFAGRREELDAVVRSLGGERDTFGSADRVYRFRALPRVDLLLLFWDREEEFPARASLLVDRDVLSYLDQEALVFLAEVFVARCLGESADQVVP